MCKNKAFLRLMLICICVTMIVGCLSLGALAASTNPVLQVDDTDSTASVEDGKIQVSLARDDVFTYNEILDLSAATKDVPLLDVEFNPTIVGTADATRVKVRLTDLYDESNYITISLNNYPQDWASQTVYVTAGAANQPQVGVENGTNVHTDDEYGFGCPVKSSLVGDFEKPEFSHLVLYYDQAEKAIYVDREAYTWAKGVVADLDNADHFGEELWEGFTTGHVKMTVFATNYQADTCNFTISTIAGNSSFQDSADQSAPVIRVDSGYEANQLPTALVGKPYPVFDAIAIDGCEGEVGYTVAVHNQATSAAVSVVDGKFTPTRAGVYVITYTAKDSAGNTATESISVTAKTGSGLQVTLEGAASATDTGVAVKLFSGISSTNASGHVSYSVMAKHQSSGEEVEIDPESLMFTPMKQGTWEITVTVQDHVSTVVKTFTVTANATTQPQVYDEVAVPKYFIKDASYNLPVLYAYDFSSGTGVATPMDVYVSGTKITGQYTPGSAGNVTVTYRLTVGGKTCEKSYSATVVDVEGGWFGTKLDMRKFFYPDGAVTEAATGSSISYTASADRTLEFLNLVQVKDLSFSFQVGSTNTYKKVNIYLTDPADGNKQVKLSYIRMTDGKAAFCVNDGPKKDLSSNFDGSSFTLSFSADTKRVSPETGVTLKVSKFLDGSPFTGFTGSVARFSVQMAEVSGTAKVVMTKLNDQSLFYNDSIFSSSQDTVAPQLFYEVPGDKNPGDEVTIPGAFVHDVLNPVATATLKVTAPNGSVLLNNVDATKDYTFTVDTRGEYTVSYTVTDGADNDATHTYKISVKDSTGPVITLGNRTELVYPGDAVTVATATVTDNLTANCTAVCYVFDQEGVNIPVSGGKFTAEKAGVYTVQYMTSDGDGNYAFASYKVTAEEDAVSTASYISQSVSLGSEVSLNLWGNVPENYAGYISGVLAYNGMKENFGLSQMTPASNGMYNIQAKMAMGQMTSPIDLTVRHPVFAEAYYKTYTIGDYLTALLEGNFDQDTKDLCLELMNLGAWAQKYFNHRTYDLVNKGYEITPANEMTAEVPKATVTGEVDGVSIYGTTVLYLSQAKVRFYFKAPGGIDGYTFKVDGTEYKPEAKADLYYVETPGINPQDMSHVITVEVTDGAETLRVDYAPIWYFIRTYHNSANTTTKGLMTAAYSYYKEAEAYSVQSTPGSVQKPETPSADGAYICLDVLITTSDNSTEGIEVGFYPGNFEGNLEDYEESFVVTAGTPTTVKLDAKLYMQDGVIPTSLGVAVLGGPENGSGNTHTLKLSNIRVEGALNRTMGLNNVVVSSGENAGFTDANDFGKASVADGAIVIEGGVCNDGHKITLLGKSNTVISLDVLINTSDNSTDPIEVRFYPYDFAGSVHSNDTWTDKVSVTAGTATTIKLELDKYLVNGELPGIGFAIMGGPEWNDANGNKHTLTVSNIHLEGDQTKGYDLRQSTFASGQSGTGYTDANGFGTVMVGESIVIEGGVRYDGHKITLVEEPDTYICLDMHFDTTSEWTDPVEIGFFPHNFTGDINNKTDKIFVTAGTDFTVKLDLDKYLVDGELPGIGFVVFGGPTYDVADRHTVTVSNIRLEGERAQEHETNIASVKTQFANSNGGGVASVVDGTVTVTGGFRYDGHMITFGAEEEPETTVPETTEPEETEPETTEPPVEEFDTTLCLDLRVDTAGGNWTDPIEIGFGRSDFTGDINDLPKRIYISAGTTTTIKLNAADYLVDGELTGISFAIFGGPEWYEQISPGVYDRTTITVSNARLEGAQEKIFDLSKSTVLSGANADFTTGQGEGTTATVDSGKIEITNGFRYDAHKITLVEDTNTYLCMDLLLEALGEWTDPIELGFYPYNFEGDINNWTEKIPVTAGTTAAIKLNVENYLVDGELTGIGFVIFGGPEWDDKLSDGYTEDRHMITISNARLEGYQSKVYDLSKSTWASAGNAGYTGANGSGTAAIGESIVITNGFRYDGHKISLVEDTQTDIVLDMLITTLGGSTDPIEVRFFPYNYTGSVGDAGTDQISITAGTTTTVKLDLDDYLVDGELTGIGFAIMGGPTWDAKLPDGTTPDRHSVTISNARLEGVQAKAFDLSKSECKTGTGAGYSWANGSGAATIGESIVITNGFQYDGHKITLVEDSQTDILLDMLITTLGGSTDPIEVRFFPYNYTGSVGDPGTDQISITAGTTTTVKLDLDDYLVDGELTGIGFAIMGGPTWDAKLPDGTTPDRHSVVISNARLEGVLAKAYDLSKSVCTTGTGAGYSWANGSGAATIGESIVITNGFQYDGHKITLVEDTNTYLCMDMLLTTLSNSTDPVNIRLFNYNYEGSVGDGYTDQVSVTAGTTTKIKVKVDNYLVDGELPGFGVCIFGGPEWNTEISPGVNDRHSVVISNVRLEGVGAQSINLNNATVANGTNGTGFTWANSGGTASITDGKLMITNGFMYDAYEITLAK